MSEPYTEEQAIRALERLAKRWPDTLWLFSASGTLCVMRKGKDGEHVSKSNDGVDDAYQVTTILGIDNDGGDW